MSTVRSKAFLTAEFAIIFVAMPLAYRLSNTRVSPIPILWMAALYALITLRSAPGFDTSQLWNPTPFRRNLGRILGTFALAACAVAIAVWKLRPDSLFWFVRSYPLFWAVVMVFYPIFSVYPQGVIYRAFFFERYRPLLGSPPALILGSAVAFSFSHIIFRNYLAVALTLAGGLLFAWRYWRTRSLFVSALEHALYGCWMFTVGLGDLFYHGALQIRR